MIYWQYTPLSSFGLIKTNLMVQDHCTVYLVGHDVSLQQVSGNVMLLHVDDVVRLHAPKFKVGDVIRQHNSKYGAKSLHVRLFQFLDMSTVQGPGFTSIVEKGGCTFLVSLKMYVVLVENYYTATDSL